MKISDISILLIRPQMGENIGAAARVMQNFGLRDLRIVSPRDGWPNEAARSMAAKAVNIIDSAQIYDTVEAATADRQLVLATTARERQMAKPAVDVRELSSHVQAGRVAIMFGPERTGLENEDIALADKILFVPTAAENPSLNLAQAVAVVAYECARREVSASAQNDESLADKAELQGLFDHLEGELDQADFWKAEGKKTIMWQNIRASLHKARLTAQEVRSWRGIVRALSERNNQN